MSGGRVAATRGAGPERGGVQDTLVEVARQRTDKTSIAEGQLARQALGGLDRRVVVRRIDRASAGKLDADPTDLAQAKQRDLLDAQAELERDLNDRGVLGRVPVRLDRCEDGAKLVVASPCMEGFSARDLKYKRAFAKAWPDPEVGRRRVAQLPRGHDIRLLQSVEEPDRRLWYADQAIEHG